MSLHTDNLVFGCARNPHDQSRSCGGSSGGDAGLLTAQCIPFAIGSDIGGSLRFPAAFCGIFGFKPTQNRVTKRGAATARALRFGQFTHLTGTVGPMGNSVSDLVIGMKVFSDPKINYHDPFLAPTPWKNDDFLSSQNTSQKIKVGILQESSFLPCSSAVKRAINLTRDALVKQGYEVVDFKIEQQDWRTISDIFLSMICNGNAPFMIEDGYNSGETLLKPNQANATVLFANPVKRFIISILIKLMHGDRALRMFDTVQILPLRAFEIILKARYQWCYEFAERWHKSGITALVSPLWPHAAPKTTDVWD